MIRIVLLSLLTVALGLAAYLFFYLGAHKTITVERQKYPELQIVYKSHLGPYHEITPKLLEVEAEMKKLGITCSKTFGEFLDNPKTVDADRLRSNVGCVVEGVTDETIAFLPADLYFEWRPTSEIFYIRFTGSPAIGPFKVYPKARDAAIDQRVMLKNSVMELYTVQRGGALITEYLFFLEDSAPSP
jgi:AraC family transcriptional regulator